MRPGPLAICSFVTMTTLCCFAQQQADVSGVVRDSSGAAVPRASITLLHQQTGTRRQAVSDERGFYAIPAAHAGACRITVRKDGFQPSARNGIHLAEGQHARFDFTLQVGAVEESVNVLDRPPQQPPDDASTGATVRRRMVENLPNNGRSLLPLLEAAPGVIITPTGNGEVGQFSANGQRSNANYMTVDGVSANFAVNDGLPGQAPSGSTPVLTALGSMQTVVSVEALEEVRIKTSAAPAEYGRLAGAQIEMTTRSGGPQLHGSFFEYLRNEKLDANNWFSNNAGLPRSPLRANDFGASLGGPLLPHAKTFFFASYEGLKLRQPFTVRDTVPSNQFRSQAPPIVRDFLDAYPAPNGPVTGDMAELTAAISRASQLSASSLRLDHNFTSNAQAFLRAYNTPSSAQGSGANLFSTGQLNLAARGLTAGFSIAPSTGWLNTVRFNYSTATARYGLVNIGTNGATSDSLFRILPNVSPVNETNESVQVYGLETVISENGDRHTQSQWNAVDTVTWSLGRHELKFGGDYRLILPSLESRPYQIFASFNSLSSLALGQISQFTVNHSTPLALVAHNVSLFAQDTWRMRRNLTFNYGLRWEWNPPVSGRAGSELAPVIDLDQPANAQLATAPTPLWHSAGNSFAPRAGFAWKPFEHRDLTVRAGTGIYYDLGYGAVMSGLASAAPFFTSRTVYDLSIYDPSGMVRLPDGNQPYARGFAYQPGFALPFSWHWNAGVEQGIGRSAVVSATYVSLDGERLLRREWLSHPNANFNGVDVNTNGAYSRYHALQLQMRSRLDSTLQYLLSFNLAKSMDNESKDSQLVPYGDTAARAADYGYSSFDVRRSWNASVSYQPKWSHGWALESILRSRSAFPINVVTGADPFQFGSGNYVLRPDVVPGAALWLDDPSAPGGRRLNPSAFAIPNTYAQGNLVRDSIRGFGFSQLDLAVRKQFRLNDRASFEFRMEAFNAFNHANLSDPQAALSSPQFGYSQTMLSSGLGTGGPANGLMPVFQIGGPRSLQASLRFRF